MKKAAIILAACLMSAGTVHAAGWENGLSAAQPYAGVPEVNLDETMGYIMLYPREKMPAEGFCGALEIYLPREDIKAGSGKVTVYDEDGEYGSVDFSDPNAVVIRPLDEDEQKGLMWGGGTCVEIHLPVSLNLGGTYHVTMDEGCFTAADGKIASLGVTGDETWVPVINGDFGINSLYYSAADQEGETEDSVPTEDADADAEEEEDVEYVLKPKAGDMVTFDVVLGGDATAAVVFSENGSVEFTQMEFKEDTKARGYIVNNDVSWGIVFLNGNGDVLNVFDF